MRIVPTEEFYSQKFVRNWKALLRNGSTYDLGNTYEWNRCWWDTYCKTGVGLKDLFVLVQEHQSEISMIFPFLIRRIYGVRKIEFIGQSGGHTTDYMSFIGGSPTKESIRQLLEFLYERLDLWDFATLVLPWWRDDLSAIVEAASVLGLKRETDWQVEVNDLCAAVPLPENFDDYLACLGKRTRGDIRRYQRFAKQHGATLEILRGDQIAKNINILYELNAQNWEVFANERDKNFMTSMLENLAAGGEPGILTVFRVDDQPCAAFLAFESNGVCFAHPSGVIRKQIKGMSPGTTMYGMFMQDIIARGFRTFDMSPGVEEYKLRLGCRVSPTFRCRFWHRQSRWLRWRALNYVNRTIVKPTVAFRRMLKG